MDTASIVQDLEWCKVIADLVGIVYPPAALIGEAAGFAAETISEGSTLLANIESAMHGNTLTDDHINQAAAFNARVTTERAQVKMGERRSNG